MSVVSNSRHEIQQLHRKVIHLEAKKAEFEKKCNAEFIRGQTSVLKEWKSSVDSAAAIDLVFGAGLSHRHFTHLRERSLVYDARKDRMVKNRIPGSGQFLSVFWKFFEMD